MNASTRERIVSAAIDLTVAHGWPSVTMARVAEDADVTRQTVYNEIGTKADLAEAMVLHELAAFLSVVQSAFDDHRDDAVEAIRDATRRVLSLSRAHPLLRSILSGADSVDLLPLLTTRGDAIHDAAVAVISERLAHYLPAADLTTRRRASDAIVRVVLSHLVRPHGSVTRAADDVAWLALRLLDSPEAARRLTPEDARPSGSRARPASARGARRP